MDLPTAMNHRRRLQNELDAISNHQSLSTSRELLLIEISRLDSMLLAKGFEMKIPVENPLLIFLVARDLNLTSVPSLVDFKNHLMAEVQRIHNFRLQPIPLTNQFVRRMIERVEEEIALKKEFERSPSIAPPVQLGGWQQYVNICIENAICMVIENDPEAGGSVNQVLSLLENDPSIQIDENVRRIARQKYFEATFHLKSKPDPIKNCRL